MEDVSVIKKAAEMNAEHLLAHFDRIADAPDAIPRLRRFVLDLAVRGKLVPQDPNDEPASELLKRIAAEKARLVKAGEIRKQDTEPVTTEEHPYNLPLNWVWSRLGAIGDWGSGSTPRRGGEGLYGGGITWLKSGELNDDCQLSGSEETVTTTAVERGSFRKNQPGDVLIAMYGATIGKVAILDEYAVTNQAVCGCTPFGGVFNQFLFLYLKSQKENFQTSSEGGAQPNISKVKIVGTLFPLPPLAEQHRIVAKVDELMTLCDRLEAAQMEREATRNRMATASLARLNAPDPVPATFQNHAAFALNNLTPLTTRPDQIKALRQTILNLAVHGKLVPQDPNDEPALELLKKIAVEKVRLVIAGNFKTLDVDFPRDAASFPFSIPDNWAWCYLDDVAAIARGGSPRPIKSYLTDDPDSIPWIKIGDSVRGNIYIEDTKERIRPEGLAKSRLVVPGDLLLSNSMSFGYPYITNIEGCIHDGWLVIRTPEAFLDKLYLHTVLLSDHAKAAFSEAASGAVVQNLNADKARLLSIPLPPLAEQHRIVAQVDELMALCARLEARLTTGDETRGRLVEALLHETLVQGTPVQARR